MTCQNYIVILTHYLYRVLICTFSPFKHSFANNEIQHVQHVLTSRSCNLIKDIAHVVNIYVNHDYAKCRKCLVYQANLTRDHVCFECETKRIHSSTLYLLGDSFFDLLFVFAGVYSDFILANTVLLVQIVQITFVLVCFAFSRFAVAKIIKLIQQVLPNTQMNEFLIITSWLVYGLCIFCFRRIIMEYVFVLVLDKYVKDALVYFITYFEDNPILLIVFFPLSILYRFFRIFLDVVSNYKLEGE